MQKHPYCEHPICKEPTTRNEEQLPKTTKSEAKGILRRPLYNEPNGHGAFGNAIARMPHVT